MAITAAQQRENRRKWVAALRSGRFAQTRRRLTENYETFCCLGVACEVFIESGNGEGLERNGLGYFEVESAMDFESELPDVVGRWLGLTGSGFFSNLGTLPLVAEGDNLASLNDNGWTFDSIAELIETIDEGKGTWYD